MKITQEDSIRVRGCSQMGTRGSDKGEDFWLDMEENMRWKWAAMLKD